MRILIWTEYYPPIIGGLERSAETQLGELARRGYEFTVITPRFNDDLPDAEIRHGIPIYRFSFAAAFTQRDLPNWLHQQARLLQIIDTFKPDLYHIFGLGSIVLPLPHLYKKRPLPLLVRLMSTSTVPQQEFAADAIIGRILGMATWVTAVSQGVLDQMLAYLPALQSRTSVLYNGHPTPRLQPTPLATPPRLLFLGRLTEQKGGDVAVAAFAELLKRYPQARLTIAGDGPERPRLEVLAAPLGHAVEFMGWCLPNQVHELINQSTLVLIPSNWEGLPNVAIEAAAMARPVVATNIPGMSEVVLDGKTGLLVEPHNPPALAAAMAALLDDPDQAHAMGQAAHAWANQRFTLARCADEYEQLYRRVHELYHAAQHGPRAPQAQ